jgi:GNAT superfamily N-acetyltransferase
LTDPIREASTPQDYRDVSRLITEYVGWLRSRYEHDAWMITEVLDKQSLSSELENLPMMYGPPNGRAFVAVQDGEVRACGAYRRLDDACCEMKRVYVPERFRGTGLGRRLCGALIAAARADGFTLMKLDTGNLLQEALALYRSLGFTPCAAYHDYPEKLLPYFVFMALSLAPPRAADD